MKTEKLKDYRRMNQFQLDKELKRLTIEENKAYGIMGMAKVASKDKPKGIRIGSDIVKRLRREKARILTIIKEKDGKTK